MSALRVVIGEQEYSKQELLISATIDVIVEIGNDPNILNFAKTTCCCLSKKYTKQTWTEAYRIHIINSEHKNKVKWDSYKLVKDTET